MQLTVKDAARLLTVSEKTVYRWIKQEIIPAYRINEQVRFNRAELLEWATSRRIPVSPEIFVEPERPATPLPSLTESLKAGGVAYRLGGDDKPSVLRALIEVIKLPDEVDREFLYQVLLAREKAMGRARRAPPWVGPLEITVCDFKSAISWTVRRKAKSLGKRHRWRRIIQAGSSRPAQAKEGPRPMSP